jgi:hypothetical protein
MNTLCPICEEGTYTEECEVYEFSLKTGCIVKVPSYYNDCNVCGVHATAVQARINKKIMDLIKEELL